MTWNDPKNRLPELGSDRYSRRVLIRVVYANHAELVRYYIAQLHLDGDGSVFFEICANDGYVSPHEVTHWADITDPITGATVI